MSRSELAATACLLVSALLLAGGFGEIQSPAAVCFGLTGVAAYGAWRWQVSGGGSKMPARLLAGGVAVAAVATFLPERGPAVLAVPVLVGAIRLGLAFPAHQSASLNQHVLWSCVFALASVLYREEPYCRQLVDDGCRSAGAVLAGVLGLAWAPASTALGWQAIAAYVFLIAVTLPNIARGWRATTVGVSLALLVASISLYAVSQSRQGNIYRGTSDFASLPDLAEMTHAGQHQVAPFQWTTPLAATYPISYQAILVILLLGSYALVVRMVPQG